MRVSSRSSRPRVTSPVPLYRIFGDVLYKLSGEFDMAVANELRDQLEQLYALGEPVVLDMADVTFIDSTCLGVFIRCMRDFGELTIANPSLIVTRVLEATGMDMLVDLHIRRD